MARLCHLLHPGHQAHHHLGIHSCLFAVTALSVGKDRGCEKGRRMGRGEEVGLPTKGRRAEELAELAQSDLDYGSEAARQVESTDATPC